MSPSAAPQADFGIRSGLTGRMCLRLHAAANWLHRRHLGPVGQFLHVLNRILTGADIDPAATISPRAVLAHTNGIVVGETAIIEEKAVIMPNVVLGARESYQAGRRHPQVCRNALIGAGAVLLGPITVGEGSRVGANAVVLKDVPPGATVVGVPAREVARQ